MKNTLLVLGVFLGYPCWVFSQQINNNGLETWINAVTHEHPQDFLIGTFAPDDGSVIKTTDTHSGQYAALLRHQQHTPSGYYFPGQLYYATGNLPDVKLQPFAARPDKMTFWYKYILAVTDTAVGYIFLTRWDGTQQQYIGLGAFSTVTSTPVYTKAVAPIHYFSNDMPDSILIFFANGSIYNIGPTPQATELYIDDIQLEYPSAVQNIAGTSRFRAYPNPLGDVLTIEQKGTGSYEIRVYNMAGTQLIINEAATSTTHTNTAFLPKGMYFVTIQDKEGIETATMIKE